MEPRFEKIRDQQKDTWNRFSTGWKKWDDFNMDFLQPIGREMINCLMLKGTENLLDVAAGTGEPGLTLAGILKYGKVVGTDLAERMLEIARSNARKRGLKNYTIRVCDVSELPFEDSFFDAITCRMGLMFFPDIPKAIQEMIRVLKPGGKMVISVWGLPINNSWITTMTATMNRHLTMSQEEAGSPGIFRCAEPGWVEDIFKKSSLKNIFEKEISGKVDYGLPGFYWRSMTELAAPVAHALQGIDDHLKLKIKKEVFAVLGNGTYPEKAVLNYSAIMVYGEK
jgi:ubiquinone/menaquinone biosynthesis C-methylase UbiE